MFLTPDELITLTGLRRPAAQGRWLRAHRVRHYMNAAGRPVVARAWLLAEAADVVAMPQRPDLRAIPGRA